MKAEAQRCDVSSQEPQGDGKELKSRSPPAKPRPPLLGYPAFQVEGSLLSLIAAARAAGETPQEIARPECLP